MKKLILLIWCIPFMSSGQVSYYPLNSNSNDALGVNNMTDANSPSYASQGIKGNCATYNGTTQISKKIGASGFSSGDVSISVGAWVKATAPGDYKIAYGFTCNNSVYRSRMAFSYTSGYYNYIFGSYYGFDNAYSVTKASALDGKWHYVIMAHGAGTGNASNSIILSWDGVQSPRTSSGGTDGAVALQVYYLTIGASCNVNNINDSFYAGSVDEVKYYNSLFTGGLAKNEYSLMKGFFQ